MTMPSQLAKDFAAQHGFTITPNGRRYDVEHGLVHVGNVGGYTAALNAMKTHLESDMQASRDSTPGAVALTEADHADMLNDPERIAGVSPQQWAQHRAETALSATSWCTEEVAQHVPVDTATRNKLVYGDERGMKGVDFPAVAADFLDFNAESKKRIRRLARRASGKPPGGPWHVILDGKTVMRYGYPSRAEAIAVVRWGFNHFEPHIRNNWRIMPVTVEYRP